MSTRESDPVRKSTRRLAVALVACSMLLVLPSCGIPPLRQPNPAPDLPQGFDAVPGTGASRPKVTKGATESPNSAEVPIEDFFADPMLISYIQQALLGNRELKILEEEIEVARNEFLQKRGAWLPFIGFGAGVDLDKPSLFTPRGAVEDQLEVLPGRNFPEPLPNYLGRINLTWAIDIWRELRNARDAARHRYFAAIERRNYFVTNLVAEIARTYYELMALDQQLATLDEIIALQSKSLELAKTKKAAGRGTELAVQRFLAELRKSQSEKQIVQQEIIRAENRINFLVNRFPQPVQRKSSGFFELDIHDLEAGLPAQLLLNRRDIVQAERELAAAGLDVLVARAAFFPKIDIRAGVGYEAFNPRFLFRPEALIYDVAGDLVAPLINKSAIKAEFRTANAKQLQALYDYQQTVLNAYIEVVNLLSKVQRYSRSLQLKRQQLAALERSVEVANKLYQSARVEYIEVMLAQRDLLTGKMEVIDTKREQLLAIVNAYRALGGGWRSRILIGIDAPIHCPPAPVGPLASLIPSRQQSGEALPPPRLLPPEPVEGAPKK